MIKILFVCHGNICRSPMAEFIFKDILTKKNLVHQFYIASAATSTEEIWNGIGNPVYPPAKAELAKHGISCEGKRAVQVTKADYDNYDYLCCGVILSKFFFLNHLTLRIFLFEVLNIALLIKFELFLFVLSA